jgi:hypothetical protein
MQCDKKKKNNYPFEHGSKITNVFQIMYQLLRGLICNKKRMKEIVAYILPITAAE